MEEIRYWKERAIKADKAVEELAVYLEKACQVIEWKSLYAKAEMEWYAEALVAEIRKQPEPETAFHGKRWYERAFGMSPHPHEGSVSVDRGETCLRCGRDMNHPVHHELDWTDSAGRIHKYKCGLNPDPKAMKHMVNYCTCGA
jgi:hypothetical protein